MLCDEPASIIRKNNGSLLLLCGRSPRACESLYSSVPHPRRSSGATDPDALTNCRTSSALPTVSRTHGLIVQIETFALQDRGVSLCLPFPDWDFTFVWDLVLGLGIYCRRQCPWLKIIQAELKRLRFCCAHSRCTKGKSCQLAELKSCAQRPKEIVRRLRMYRGWRRSRAACNRARESGMPCQGLQGPRAC